MTRKLLVINMSNWANEAYSIVENEETQKVLQPGEFYIDHGENDIQCRPIKRGRANGYEPPDFPREVVGLTEERRSGNAVQLDSEKLDRILKITEEMRPRPRYSPGGSAFANQS